MTTDIQTTNTTIASEINAEHRLAEASARDAIEHALRAGALLAEAKASVPHGGWLPWIEQHCEFSTRTAQGYMRLHERRGLLEKRNGVAHLPLRDALRIVRDRSRPAVKEDLLRTLYPGLTDAHVDAVEAIRDASAFAGATRRFHEDLDADTIADAGDAVQFLALIKPLDHPVAWIVNPGEEILEACRRFSAEIHAAPIVEAPWRSVPSWRVAALWYLSLAAYLRLHSNHLAVAISDFLRALDGSRAFWAAWSCDARSPARYHAGTDMEGSYGAFGKEWWGHLSDMRHAGILDEEGGPRMDRVERARLIGVAINEGMILPSSMQPRGWREDRRRIHAE